MDSTLWICDIITIGRWIIYDYKSLDLSLIKRPGEVSIDHIVITQRYPKSRYPMDRTLTGFIDANASFANVRGRKIINGFRANCSDNR